MKALVAALVLLAACAVPPRAGSGAPRRGTVPAPDGVPIAYDVRGSGEPALVFVHCWACDREYWRHQADALAGRHRVVTLDLAGHGASGAGRARFTIAGLGGDVAAVVTALDLRRVVLVGHSMGGPVALEAARLLRGRVEAVVAVDTLHDAARPFPKEAFDGLIARYRKDFGGTMDAFVGGMFPGGPSEARDWTMARARQARPEVALALFGDFQNLDLPAMLRAAGVKVRCINAAPPNGPPTAVEANRAFANFDAVYVEGAGHFLQLERPEAFNGRLAEVLAELERR